MKKEEVPQRQPRQRAASLTAVRSTTRSLRNMYRAHIHMKSVLAKAVVVIYMAYINVINFRLTQPRIAYFTYLTAWGWTIETVYFFLALCVDVRGRIKGPHSTPPVLRVAVQALSEIVFALQVVVVSFFWGVIYPPEATERYIPTEMHLHLAGLVLVIADYLYRRAGFSLRNNKHLVLVAGLYMIIHAVVVLRSGTPIYPGVTFKDVRSYVIFLGAFSVIVLFHKVFYLWQNWDRVKNRILGLAGLAHFLILRHDSFDDSALESPFPSRWSSGPVRKKSL